MDGTTGKVLSILGIRASISLPIISGSISYQAHMSNIGWGTWTGANRNADTNKNNNTIEAIKFQLNGQPAGTKWFAYPIEAVQVYLVSKNQGFNEDMSNSYREKRTKIILTNVPWISQYRPVFAPWGCASAVMAMLIGSREIHVDLKYAQDTLPMYPANIDG